MNRRNESGADVDRSVLDLDAIGQAELIARKEISPRELLELVLDAVDRCNPAINAVIHRLDDSARSAADDPAPGPFSGVPMFVKDGVCHTAGDPFHCGMRVLRDADWRERDDAALARRFRAAGFVIAGKTNLPELAMSVTTEPLAYGPTRNPWALDRSPGGSSGGSGAAVAARMVAVAHGNDMGGSIRIPSSACGLVGLKPTRARTSLAPAFGEYWAMTTHEFVLVRSVRDAAAILDCVAGPEPGDPYTAPAPLRPWALEPGADPGRVRIGWRTDARAGLMPTHPEVVAAVEHTASLLAELGHDVDRVAMASLDDPRIDAAMGLMFPVFAARDVERWSRRLGRPIALDELEPQNAMLCEFGRAITAEQFLDGVETTQAWSRAVARHWSDDGYDLLLVPTLGDVPVHIGELAPDRPDRMEVVARDAAITGFVAPWNLSGQPAISLPMAYTHDGVPIGVQLVAEQGREDILLRVAAQLEAASEWNRRRPVVCASDPG